MKELRKKELIIVAGPSASGKSYIMSQLKTKKKNQFKSDIFRELNINPRKSKSCISIGALMSALKNSSDKPKHYRKLKKKIIFIHLDLTGRHQKQKRQLLLLAAKRQLISNYNWIIDGNWEKKGNAPLTNTIEKLHVGLLGYGRIGQAIARKLLAFNCNISYHARNKVENSSYKYYKWEYWFRTDFSFGSRAMFFRHCHFF